MTLLSQELFSELNKAEVMGFQCGNEAWELAAAQWIQGGGAEQSIQKHQTNVWLYFTENDELVGFSSLGKTRRRWPPPDGQFMNLLLIPQVAIATAFQGQPQDDPPRYSQQIMEHLLFEAHQWAEGKIPLLMLKVHEQNLRAIHFYQKFEFHLHPDAKDRDHLLMTHRLAR